MEGERRALYKRRPEKATVDRTATPLNQGCNGRKPVAVLLFPFCNPSNHVISLSPSMILPFYRPLRPSNLIASLSRVCTRLAHSSGKPPTLRHRDWGVVGRLSRPPALIDEVPNDGVQQEDEEGSEKKTVRYQTDNYTPGSNPTPSRWAQHRASLKEKFPDGWAPPHKLSRAAMDGLRALHAHDPDTFTTPVLADKFRVSPEAVRRILRGKWQPTQEQRTRLLERERRHRQDRIRSKIALERTGGKENKWRRKTSHQT